MRFLALTTRPLRSRGSGYDLRVANLCAHLPGEVHHVVAPYQPYGPERAGLPLASGSPARHAGTTADTPHSIV